MGGHGSLPNIGQPAERAPEQRRERYLSPPEIARLAEALAVHPERTSANVIRLLLLTGARRGEVLGAQWSDFDLEAGVWVKPASATKQAKLHRVPLAAPALALLAELRVETDVENELRRKEQLPELVHVFPGARGKPLQEIKKTWGSVCRAARIEGVRVHDLRHTYASILASSGLSLPIIGALLGHSQPATTNRYAGAMIVVLLFAAEGEAAIFAVSIQSNQPTDG